MLLAVLTFAGSAFGTPTASGGNVTAAAGLIGSDSDANASGTATWFRALKQDGTTVVFDGSVGTSGADLNLNTTNIVIHSTVSCSAFSIVQSE